jgi:hypothetical protein
MHPFLKWDCTGAAPFKQDVCAVAGDFIMLFDSKCKERKENSVEAHGYQRYQSLLLERMEFREELREVRAVLLLDVALEPPTDEAPAKRRRKRWRRRRPSAQIAV